MSKVNYKHIVLSTLLCSFLIVSTGVQASRRIQQAGQPMPADMDSQWLVIKGQYVNHKLMLCQDKGGFSMESTCVSYEPEEYLKKRLGPGYYPVGMSPFLNEAGDQLGVVLYYKENN